MTTILVLPVQRCDDCGDEIVSPTPAAICTPCIRRAELRRRLQLRRKCEAA